jgi:hypothetical protein
MKGLGGERTLNVRGDGKTYDGRVYKKYGIKLGSKFITNFFECQLSIQVT